MTNGFATFNRQIVESFNRKSNLTM